MASFILFLGYASSAFFAFESIDGVAKLAHDEDIERSLAAHLESIKRIHALEQELLLERLSPLLRGNTETLSEESLRSRLKQAQVPEFGDPAAFKIVRAPGDKISEEIAWIDRDHLKVGAFVVEFPKGSTYDSFKAAEDVRQRYQLVGAKLNEDIRPTLIKATTTILIVCFLLLASLFLLYAQRFKARVGEVLSGFVEWSEKDSGFRFGSDYPGELRLITGQFNAMAEEVEANRQKSLYLEKIASWQIIARKLAHEIKNPLTPIQMMVSQLKRRYKGDDEQFGKLLEEAQQIITEEVSGLRRMVDNFSNFARLPEPNPKAADLRHLCHHVVELQKAAYERHDIAFVSELEDATAVFDEDLLRQVLINLIKNAAEASADRSAKILVTLNVMDSDLAISVTDDGPGIPQDLQKRIFEAYFTTKHHGPNPGMGLGLAVCQKIVMDHAGQMQVSSRPGETMFTIRLPRRKKGQLKAQVPI